MRLPVGIHRPPSGCLWGFFPIDHGAKRRDDKVFNLIPKPVDLISESETCCLQQSQSFCLAPFDETWKYLSAAIHPAAQFLASICPVALINSPPQRRCL